MCIFIERQWERERPRAKDDYCLLALSSLNLSCIGWNWTGHVADCSGSRLHCNCSCIFLWCLAHKYSCTTYDIHIHLPYFSSLLLANVLYYISSLLSANSLAILLLPVIMGVLSLHFCMVLYRFSRRHLCPHLPKSLEQARPCRITVTLAQQHRQCINIYQQLYLICHSHHRRPIMYVLLDPSKASCFRWPGCQVFDKVMLRCYQPFSHVPLPLRRLHWKVLSTLVFWFVYPH